MATPLWIRVLWRFRVRWLHAQDRDREIGPLIETFAQRGQKHPGTVTPVFATPEEKARQLRDHRRPV